MKTKSSRLLALALAFTMMLSFSACAKKDASSDGQTNAGGATSSAAPTKKDVKTIKIGYLNVMDDAQTLLANDAGFYTQNGLKAEMTVFTSGTDLIKAIVGGQLDAGVLGFTNAVTWVDKGADLKVVGGAQLGYHSMIVNKDSGIKSLADLKGKKIASQKPGSTADVVLNGVVLPSAKLTKNDVQIVGVEPANAIQSLQAHQVDAAFVFEPFDSIARKQFGAQSIYEIGKAWPFPCMVVITSGDMLKKDRDTINRMLDAQKQAIELMQKDPAKAAGFITKRFIDGDSIEAVDGTKVSATSIITDAIKSQTFNYNITPDQTKRMQEIIDIMKTQGSLDKPVKVEDFLDLTWQNAQKK